jgi:valyl-tRNA synthetase
MNVPAGARIDAFVVGGDAQTERRVAAWRPEISRLARLDAFETAREVPPGAIQILLGDATVCLPLGAVIDVAAETARLQKDLSRIDAEIAGLDAKLGNEQFTARAPEHVVEEQRERRDEAAARQARIAAAVSRLNDVA